MIGLVGILNQLLSAPFGGIDRVSGVMYPDSRCVLYGVEASEPGLRRVPNRNEAPP